VTVLVFSLCSTASGLAGGFAGLLAARMMMGVAEGPILPIAQSIMAAESSPARRGLNMGILQALGAAVLGSFLAPLVLVSLAETHGWRSAFLLAGVPGVVLALCLALWLREPPLPRAEVASVARPRLAELLKHRNLLLCVAISICLVGWMIIGWVFLPLYYVQVRGFRPGDMSIVMSAMGVAAGLFGAFIGPALSDRFGRRPLIVVLSFTGLGAPLVALFLHAPLAVMATATFVGWGAAGALAMAMATVPAESLPAGSVATAIGLTQGTGEIVGGVIAPVLAGLAGDAWGLQAPLLVAAALAGAAGLIALFLTETAPRVTGATGFGTPVAVLGDSHS
jgi:predicted MFS family arabinose efflux permease